MQYAQEAVDAQARGPLRQRLPYLVLGTTLNCPGQPATGWPKIFLSAPNRQN